MYKVKRFSKKSLAKEVWENAKKQAKENPITAASLSLMSINAANNLYNTESSRKARKRTEEFISGLSAKDKKKIVVL